MSSRYENVDIDEYAISASQLKKYSTCPLQYWFRYIEAVETPQADNVYLRLGNRVHETLEEMLGGEDHPPFNDHRTLKLILREHYDAMDRYELPDDERERGRKCVEKAADVLHDRKPTLRGIELEKTFRINRPDIDTSVNAKIDVVTEDEVWDWKTGRVRPDETPHEETLQGAVYMAAFNAEFGEPPKAVRFFYLSPDASKRTDSKGSGPVARTVDPSDENWQEMLRVAKSLQSAKETGEFPAKPGSHCYWCDFEMYCPTAPAGVGNVPWRAY